MTVLTKGHFQPSLAKSAVARCMREKIGSLRCGASRKETVWHLRVQVPSSSRSPINLSVVSYEPKQQQRTVVELKGSKLLTHASPRRSSKLAYFVSKRMGSVSAPVTQDQDYDELISEYQKLTDRDLHGALSPPERFRLDVLEQELFRRNEERAEDIGALRRYEAGIAKLDELIRLNERIKALLVE